MGILDGIVEWIAEQVMAGLDLVTTSVLGALGCDMAVFLRYFPAAETMYSVFVALAIGIILLNWVWQLFKNFGLGAGVEAEDPVKLSSVRFEQRHNDCFILRAHSLVDRSSISQIHIAQIIYAIFQRPASTKIHADLFALVSVLNIPDETQITIRYLFCVLGLHDAVIDPEYLGAKLDFLLRRAEWVDQFTNGLIQLWGDRIFEKCGIGRDEGGDGGKTLEIRGKRRLSARDGGANYQQS